MAPYQSMHSNILYMPDKRVENTHPLINGAHKHNVNFMADFETFWGKIRENWILPNFMTNGVD